MKCPDISISHRHSLFILAEPAFEPALSFIRFLTLLADSRLCGGDRDTSNGSAHGRVADGLDRGCLGVEPVEPVLGLGPLVQTLLLQSLLLQLVVGAVDRAGVGGLAVVCGAGIVRHGRDVVARPLVAVLRAGDVGVALGGADGRRG